MVKRVSIIIPFYNCSYIDQSIESALNQTYSTIEVIVVNDGSTKYTEKVHPFLHRIHYIEKSNGGTASALNKGIHHMTGNYFCWLSSDDVFYPEKVEVQLKKMEAIHSKVSYANYYPINEKGEIFAGLQGVYVPGRVPFIRRMQIGNIINGCSVMIHRSVFSEIGLFDDTLPYTHDYDMWLRILHHHEFFYLPEPLLLYRVHEEMGTKKHAQVISAEIRKVKQRHASSMKILFNHFGWG
ncbi:Glycosyl transferase family 2 [Marininema mesophilum]|uniref:Glycosyl transferase family 2 n=1 Tax=Marininema mesophilum TaxID=1048340 RepID=A0A1H2WHW0_9BACL|nr:glycosyltransferase [Marininema mesophilum]SDW80253.1 Glycosyl transferase family 2 [Marininema mesophilum]